MAEYLPGWSGRKKPKKAEEWLAKLSKDLEDIAKSKETLGGIIEKAIKRAIGLQTHDGRDSKLGAIASHLAKKDPIMKAIFGS